MSEQLVGADRNELRTLLLAWRDGELTFDEVPDKAEAIEDRVWTDAEVIEFPDQRNHSLSRVSSGSSFRSPD